MTMIAIMTTTTEIDLHGNYDPLMSITYVRKIRPTSNLYMPTSLFQHAGLISII
jgi:hypothetical protein